MKNKKFTLGFVIGAMVFSSVTAFAGGYAITAYKQDYVDIVIDDQYVTLNDGSFILNFNDRLYTPVRDIAEGMGGTVEYDKATSRVFIKTPEPQVTEIIKEVPVEVTVAPQQTYNSLPIRKEANKLYVEVLNIYANEDETEIYVDVENDSADNSIVTLDYSKAYITDESGNTYKTKFIAPNPLLSSIPYDDELENVKMLFESIPENTKNISLFIPVTSTNEVSLKSNTETLEYRIKLNSTNFRYSDDK